MSVNQQFSSAIWVALAFATVACGSVPLNQVKLTEAQTALHAAETLGAENDPKAKQSLQLARDQIATANRLGADGDGDQGDLYLEQATVDAELASQVMRTRAEEQKARDAWAKLGPAGSPTQAPQ